MKTQKTKKSFKKKALLSSLSMLMVATVAVGSATFAWFTSNPYATAKGLQMKATASKGLVIQTASHKAVDETFWGHTDYLKYDATANSGAGGSSAESVELAPVSFDLTGDALGSAFTVTAAADDSYAASTDPSDKVETAAASNYYTEDILCKVTGSTDGSGATLKATSLAITTTTAIQKSGIRVAIEYNGALIGVYAPDETTNKYLSGTAGQVYTTFTLTDKTFEADSSVSSLTLGTVGVDGTDKITVTVYLDGEDSNVYSQSIAASNIVSSIQLDLKAE